MNMHQPACKTHPDAPHGFLRNASHTENRYVCECEYWTEPGSDQIQQFDLFDNPVAEALKK
jgi:hypothetical protein